MAPVPRSDVFRAYWTFAAERQRVFEKRLRNEEGPWTSDEIVGRYRFTNAFRASDRVSQYLIRDVIYVDGMTFADTAVRTILFRLFSRPSTWQLLERAHGPITCDSFDPVDMGRTLDVAFGSGTRLYTNAFILCANAAFGHARKHRNHLALVEAMIAADLPQHLEQATSLGAAYTLLVRFPLIGPFMAYQLAIDLNYAPWWRFDENSFTAPGPGAMRGLAKVFSDLGGLRPDEAVNWLVDQQQHVTNELDVEPPVLFGRPLHAIDCQNLLCEIDKYARVAFPHLTSDRQRIKQTYRPAREQLRLFYPPHWKINKRIPAALRAAPSVEQMIA